MSAYRTLARRQLHGYRRPAQVGGQHRADNLRAFTRPYSTPFLPPLRRGGGVPLPPCSGGSKRVYCIEQEVTRRV